MEGDGSYASAGRGEGDAMSAGADGAGGDGVWESPSAAAPSLTRPSLPTLTDAFFRARRVLPDGQGGHSAEGWRARRPKGSGRDIEEEFDQWGAFLPDAATGDGSLGNVSEWTEWMPALAPDPLLFVLYSSDDDDSPRGDTRDLGVLAAVLPAPTACAERRGAKRAASPPQGAQHDPVEVRKSRRARLVLEGQRRLRAGAMLRICGRSLGDAAASAAPPSRSQCVGAATGCCRASLLRKPSSCWSLWCGRGQISAQEVLEASRAGSVLCCRIRLFGPQRLLSGSLALMAWRSVPAGVLELHVFSAGRGLPSFTRIASFLHRTAVAELCWCLLCLWSCELEL